MMPPEVRRGFEQRRQDIRDAGEGELKSTRGHFRITCTARGTHPPREIARLNLWYDPEDLQMYEDLAQTADTPEEAAAFLALYDADRLGYTERRINKRGDATVAPDPIARKDLGDELWRFRCPTCKRDAPLTRSRLTQLLDGLARMGKQSIDLSHLTAILSNT